ncbi:hypothetical protein [Chitinophaga sp. 22308]|uniref:hypothetical protein n=1 Tax=unclassified Chitinophaga TaxID=2619133 RepID=UPI003F846643
MQLNFIWIKSYKNIEKLGFSFSDEFLYNYDQGLGKLLITPNVDYVPDIYGESISALSAIIGMNGAGKSTLLEFLLFRLGSHSDSSFTAYTSGFECIAIFDKTIFCHSSLKIENLAELEQMKFECCYFDETICRQWIEEAGRKIFVDRYQPSLGYRIIYYSNIFDIKYIYDYSHSIDISTKTLLYTDAAESPGFRSATRSGAADRVHPINAFRAEELRRQMNLITEGEIALPIALPKYVYLFMDDRRDTFFGEKTSWFTDQGMGWLIDIPDHLYDVMMLIKSKVVSREEFKNNFICLFKYRIFLSLGTRFPTKVSELNEELVVDFIFSHAEILPQQVIDIFLDDGAIQVALVLIFSALEKVVHSSDIPEQWLSIRDDSMWETFGKIQVASNEDSQVLFDLIRYYNIIVGDYNFLTYQWPGFSSGENNMLVFYSRFFSIRKHEGLKNAHNLIILIDEGETYFHPDWQRKYLDMIVGYLGKLFSGKKIQLIITSNSPFIISDVPKSKINFLALENGAPRVLEHEEFKDETFGSNIHSLYTNAFFLQNTLIGEVARKWIERIIQDLNNRDFVHDEAMVDQLKKKIGIIGEPVIRTLLLQRLDHETEY